MRLIFKNGATRARAMAWARWLGPVGLVTGLALVTGLSGIRAWGGLLVAAGLWGGLVLVRRCPRKIPVLNYHSVSECPEWLQLTDQVSLTPAAFERQLIYLERQGYRTLFVSEVSDMLAGKIRLRAREKVVALTFDDGYADNWIAVLPLLEQYGMKATVFVSTGFITDATECRPTIGKTARAEWGKLDWSGYLTWPELKAMQRSGLVEIQSHGHTHSRVFAGPELKGFVGPEKNNVWMLWNAHPEMQPYWWRASGEDRSLWGCPVFRQVPALAHPAYRPDPAAVAHLAAWVKKSDETFFTRSDWEQRLQKEWRHFIRQHGAQGSWEESAAYERRIGADLTEAKRVLERQLGTKVEGLCWPENQGSEAGGKVARQCGYMITVSNRHPSRNEVGRAPGVIVRTFIGSHATGLYSPFLDFVCFVLELKVFEGWYVGYPILAVMHRARRFVLAVRRSFVCRRDYVSVWE